MRINSIKEIRSSWLVLVSAIIAIITFPLLNPVYANGIDPPLSWVFNFLVQGRLFLGKDIIFPHGPLAFMMYPLPIGANLWIAVIFHLLARAGFAYSLLMFRKTGKISEWIEAFLTAFLILAFLDFLLVIIGIVITGYFHYLKNRKTGWILISLVLTVLAVYVKAFVGIVCGMISLAFFVILTIEILRKESSWKQLLFALVPLILLVSVWLIMYGTISGLPRYFYGMMQLAGDNSAAVAYYPDNNWVVLSLSFGLMVMLSFLHFKDPDARKYMILVLPALFAVWKYGMAREDYLHAGMLFLFIGLILLLFNLIIANFRIITLFIGLAIIGFSYQNLKNAYYFEPPVFSVSGVKTLGGLLFDYKHIADTCMAGSARNIRRNCLDSELRKRVGDSYTDIFPWDYSFIPANHLNWRPRPVLQSYACYTPWLDMENSSHFSSASAPAYLIWELRKITHDIHNGTLESIDGRYLLNDQPETVLAILSNYHLVLKQGGRFPVLLFEKLETPIKPVRKTIKSESCSWNTWVDVPEVKDGILRAKTILDRNFPGSLKSLLYKDEACYIYYRLNDGEIRMYRVVPKNAAQGIWVNPLFMNAENNLLEPAVKSIMFRCSNPELMKKEIPLSWEHIQLSTRLSSDSVNEMPYSEASLLFGKDQPAGSYCLFSSLNDLESDAKFWSFNPGPDNKIGAISGTTSCKVAEESYSMSFFFPLDSLAAISNDSTWLIRTSGWINSGQKLEGLLVISIEKDGQSLLWKPVELDKFVIENNTWNYACNFLEVTHSMVAEPGMKLKVYIWNKGKNPFWVDDMQVRIER